MMSAKTFVLSLILAALPALAQPTVSLTIASGSGLAGSVVSLPINISSSGGALPTAVQWGFALSSGITGVTVDVGPSASSAGKSLSCSGTSCLVFGLNATSIPNGTIAVANFQLSASATGNQSVSLTGVVASDVNSIPSSGGSGLITVTTPLPTTALNTVACGTGAIQTPGSLSCSVTLTAAAPAGGFGVSLSSNNASLSVPASVTVIAGQTTAAFTATGALVTVGQTATVTAVAGGVSRTTNVSLISPAVLSSLTCAPSSLNSGQSASCTVLLDKASAGGATVTLSDDSAQLSTPGSVAIGNGASSATFTVTAASIASSQTATVTANLNGVARTAQVSLVAPAGLSGLSCAPNSFSAAGSATCTVTLVSAVAANTLVTLSDGSASVTVPASVTVSAGQSSAQFGATVVGVSANEMATITASLNGGTQSATLTLTAPVVPAVLSSLTCAPGSLNSGQSATCTVALDKASAGGVTVTLSDDSAQLSTPGSAAIANGASSATFTVTAASIASSQTATVTANLNGVTRTTQVSLVAPVGLSGLNCTPNSFSAAGSATCTVTLVSAVAANTLVTVSDGSANVTVPASVTVSAGQSSAQFGATVAGVSVNETATITASLNGGTQSATLTLTAPVVPAVLSSLTCAPSSLNSNQGATCTVLLDKASAGGATVTLSDDSAQLSTPGSVAVGNGANSATFTATAGTITTSQTATVTANLNGVARTAQVSLVAPADTPAPPAASGLSSLSCSPSTVVAGGSSVCVVTLGAVVSTPSVVGLSSSSDAIALASSVTVPQGADSAQFRVNIPLSAVPQQLVLSASLAAQVQTATITVTAAAPGTTAPQLSSLACSPSRLGPGETGACTVYLTANAEANLSPAVTANSPSLIVPGSLQVLASMKSQSFTVVAAASISSNQTVEVVVNLNGQSVSTRLTVDLGDVQPRLTSFNCSSTSIPAGGGAVCVVSFASGSPFSTDLSLVSSQAIVRVPSRVAVAAGATSTSFAVQAGATDSAQSVTLSAAWHGQAPLTKVIQVTPPSISLVLPSDIFSRAGTAISFDVKATHSAGLATSITAQGLPSGAAMRGERFTWTPSDSQLGEYAVQFRASDGSGLSGSASERIVVRDSVPKIQGLFNPAGYTPIESCSPNAIVTFLGSGFSLHDPIQASSSPWPTELAGVRIRINGVYAPITFVSDTTVHFQCPALDPGVTLEMVMEYEAAPSIAPGAAAATAIVTVAPVVVKMSDATPGLYLIKGTQAAVLIAGTGFVAGPPPSGLPGERYAARPAVAGEYLEIYANGMGAANEALAPGQSAPLDHLITLVGRVTAVFGDGQKAPAVFAGLTPGSVGLFQINVQVPEGTRIGDAIPLYIELTREDGSVVRSNTATIAVSVGR